MLLYNYNDFKEGRCTEEEFLAKTNRAEVTKFTITDNFYVYVLIKECYDSVHDMDFLEYKIVDPQDNYNILDKYKYQLVDPKGKIFYGYQPSEDCPRSAEEYFNKMLKNEKSALRSKIGYYNDLEIILRKEKRA